MTGSRRGSRRGIALVALALLSAGLAAPVEGLDAPFPDACKLHPTQVVNPGCVPALTGDVSTPGITLPNLVPDVQEVFILRPFLIDPDTGAFTQGDPLLYFDSRAQNLGTVPVQLTVNEVQDPENASVSQCVSWTAARACREQRPVGGFTWHQEHTHFHYTEFAAYELRRIGADGHADYSSAGLIASSDKVSFCLIDSEQVRDDAFPAPFYGTCLPTVQGISPGWTDVYTADLEGQQLPLAGLSDGRYSLVIKLNYAQHVYEANYDDDVVEVTVEISNGATDASIVDKYFP